MAAPEHPSHKKAALPKKTLIIAVLVGLFLVLSSTAAYFLAKKYPLSSISKNLSFRTQQLFQKKPTPTPSPTPQKRFPDPIVKGKLSYSISRGSGSKGPSPYQFVVDPTDPQLNESQAMYVKIKSEKPVTSVSITLNTDTKKIPHPLKLKEGSNKDGTWEGSWITNDTHDFTYNVTIEAKDDTDTAKIDVMVRP